MKFLRHVGAFVTAIAACTVVAAAACAEKAYPDKLVNLVVPYSPGGASDAGARALEIELRKLWSTSIIVVNVAGAGGSIGVQRVLNAPHDGYQILLMAGSDAMLTPLSLAAARFRSSDLKPVAILTDSSFILATRTDIKPASLSDFMTRYASAHGNARKLTYATNGEGSQTYLMTAMLTAPVDPHPIMASYRGLGQQVNDLVAGNVDVSFLPLAGPVLGMLQDKRIHAVAITSDGRNPDLPDVPTFRESKAADLSGIPTHIWFAAFVPADTPPDITAQIQKALYAASQGPTFQTYVKTAGSMKVPTMTLQQLDERYRDETEKFRKAFVSMNIKPQ